MPLSEFLRMARGKLESDQQRTGPTNPSTRNDDDLVELIWENGHIAMQGQSSRGTRSPALQNLLSGTPGARAAAPRIEKFGGVGTILDDFSPAENSGDLAQDDDMVPWLHYQIHDPLPNYCSDILPELSGVTATGTSIRNSFVLADKKSNCDQSASNFHNGGNGLAASSREARALPSWPPRQGRMSDHSLGSGVSGIISSDKSNHTNVTYGNSAPRREAVNDSMGMKVERQNMGLSSNNSNFLNFSHFSRPTDLVKANLPNSDKIRTSVASGAERMDVKEKGIGSISNPEGSRLNNQLNSLQKGIDFQGPSAFCAMTGRQPAGKALKESFPDERSENLCRKNSAKNDNPLIPSSATADAIKGVVDGDGTVEPMMASSSVGSGNSADRYSYEQTHNSKRKFRDIEESQCHGDDIDSESVGVKKATGRGGTGSKRSRAAEVHNLSERRRRDRINEKMRALQELIPNCNKADKASMLDEAIEYLKTLQVQVQIMSMGAGLCMPHVMFPPGMHPAHMPHFSHMGVGMGMGMGMGMGFGMNILDMNVASSGIPILPRSPMQGAHFPSPISGPVNFQTLPGPNLPVYGHPSQGLPSSIPMTPLVRSPVTSDMGLSSSRKGTDNELPVTCPTLNTENPVANKNLDPTHNVEASSSNANQVCATNEVSDKSAGVQEKKQDTDVEGTAALTSNKSNITTKEAGEKTT